MPLKHYYETLHPFLSPENVYPIIGCRSEDYYLLLYMSLICNQLHFVNYKLSHSLKRNLRQEIQ